jgi:hypothetical protein
VPKIDHRMSLTYPSPQPGKPVTGTVAGTKTRQQCADRAAPVEAIKPISGMSVTQLPIGQPGRTRHPFPADQFGALLDAAQACKGALPPKAAAAAIDEHVRTLGNRLQACRVDSRSLGAALQRTAALCANHAITADQFAAIMTALTQAADGGRMKAQTAVEFVETLAGLPGESTGPVIQRMSAQALGRAVIGTPAEDAATGALLRALSTRPEKQGAKILGSYLAQDLSLVGYRAKSMAFSYADRPCSEIVAGLRRLADSQTKEDLVNAVSLARALAVELEEQGRYPPDAELAKAFSAITGDRRKVLTALRDGAAQVSANRAAEPGQQAMKHLVRQGRFDHGCRMIARSVKEGDYELARELGSMLLTERSSRKLAHRGRTEASARSDIMYNWLAQEQARPVPPAQKAETAAVLRQVEVLWQSLHHSLVQNRADAYF